MRAFVEERGTIDSAYKALGVSRATLFNWFGREEPPPGDKMRQKLRAFLGAEADYILDGSPTQGVQLVQNSSRPDASDTSGQLSDQARGVIETLISRAAGDITKLGWLNEELKQLQTRAAKWVPETIGVGVRGRAQQLRDRARDLPAGRERDVLLHAATMLDQGEDEVEKLLASRESWAATHATQR